LKQKFTASITVMPIPAGEDFRIDLGADATAQIRRELEEKASSRVTDAMTGLFERIKGLIGRMVEAPKAEKTDAIRKSLFTSINTLVDSLPILNVTGDTALDAFASDIRGVIDGLDAKNLRDVPAARAEVLLKADAILSKMNDFLG
jgi:hypothetical protein